MRSVGETRSLLGSDPEDNLAIKKKGQILVSSKLVVAILLLAFMAGRYSSSSSALALSNASLVANPDLVDYGAEPSKEGSLRACEGDCDTSADCAGVLECFERDGFAYVPGCNGPGVWDHDYCVNPGPLPLIDLGATPGLLAQGGKLGQCEGDCDNSADCAGDLVCYQRGGDKHIPGCRGPGTLSHDYCTDPKFLVNTSKDAPRYSDNELAELLSEMCNRCAGPSF